MAELLEIKDANLSDPAFIRSVVEGLSAGARRDRQRASEMVFAISQSNPDSLVEFGDEIIAALDCKEAHTRWGCLDALTNLIPIDSRLCDKVIPEAEASLFDEDNGPVRLSAFRFLCKLGSTTENRADKVWPLLDEAVQCYHGDAEYNDMLSALAEFATGKASAEIRESIVARMSFDAANAKGGLKRRSQAVIDSANKKK